MDDFHYAFLSLGGFSGLQYAQWDWDENKWHLVCIDSRDADVVRAC